MPSISARRDDSPMTDSMCCFVGLLDADVAGDEFVVVFELAERAGGLHQHGSRSMAVMGDAIAGQSGMTTAIRFLENLA